MESAVKNLAKLDASNITNVFSNSFNAGGKTVYSYGNNNYLVNRMRDLRSLDEDLIKGLQTISFTKNSKWLKDLTTTDETLKAAMASHFGTEYVSLEALKKMFTESKDNRKLSNLVAAEHEVAKINFFFNGSKFTDDGNNVRRKVSFFYPTMSDKTTMILMNALSQELKLNKDGTLSEDNIDSLYESTVLPEISRMMAEKKAETVDGYEPDNFYFFHELNNLMIDINLTGNEKSLKEHIVDGEGLNPVVTKAVKEYLSTAMTKLVDDKVKDWKKLGIGNTDSKAKDRNTFLDANYMRSIAKGNVRYAAADFVFNSLIANAEMHMVSIGDPALYAKFKKNNTLEENLAATFVNIGKRLAGDIAPGMELADNQNNKYHQVFFQDTEMESNNVKDSVQLEFFSKIMKDYKDNYSGIEGSDAQEYTTWKEHLYVMKQMGRLTTQEFNKLSTKLASQSRKGVRKNNKLTYDELGLILQPMKPVYVGNQMSVDEDVDRRLYIKSSSFPLIPELTTGMGIDNVRKSLETFETENNTTVRASFRTANKIGAVKNSIEVLNTDGSIKSDLKITEGNTLLLDRKNFRIQQDVPYKREKDSVNIGTQARKLLFVNLLDVQIEDGVTGEQLKEEYDQYYEELFQDAQEQLKIQLGLVDGQATIPAIKLQEILVKEVKTRQGYPKSMIEALELNTEYKLNENGEKVIDLERSNTRFKIPLWASPYASKFESLLTSIVSKKVIKQKFPGYSYVLGSEEGFRIKKGDEASEELAKSGIVFSNEFDPKKGLQPMRLDPVTKKILPAQIMIPFKFRDENGNLLKVEEFTTTDENGRTILDTDKIPKKVLQLFGFRIPTQERNSMSAVEIVGFLPEASGDLLLAPRDWTKQMGSDFDVDKLFTYMRNTFYKDGKLHTDFLTNKEEIEANIKEVEEQLQLTKDQIQELKDLPTGDENLVELLKAMNLENKRELVSELLLLNRSYRASRQNAILDIHDRVMTSTNPEVIASIMALDSFGEFEDLAASIQETRTERGLVKQHVSILSDSYQRMKYINATAGKNGVGTFSLDSSFNSVIQGKDLIIINLTEETKDALYKENDGKPSYQQVLALNDEIASFGDVSSLGDLSNKYTLASQNAINRAKAAGKPLTSTEKAALKTKSTVIRTLQSSAVDNENAQLLDKLNINDETFDAIKALALLGFEEKEIAGLITQEIVWEFVEALSNSRSSLTGFTPDVEATIFADLLEKYDPSKEFSKVTKDKKELLSNQSGEELLNNIKTKTLKPVGKKEASPEYNLQQLALLEKFMKLTAIGKDIKKVQAAINSESKGAPNSLIETSIKVDQINNISQGNILNTENLLGEYEKGELVKPTTINGYAAMYGVKFANEVFTKYYPYKQDAVQQIFSEVLAHLPLNDDLGTTRKAEIQTDIFKGVRSYLISDPNSGLFTDSVNTERARLFVDNGVKNKSLATIITELSNESWFEANGFLNKLMPDLNSNGEISRVNFEASSGENFDERNIYQGFNDLLQSNKYLGTFNTHEYTGRMLAQDLIMAAFLEGGNQGAKQYLKYIPVHYLKSMGFGEHLQGSNFDKLTYETNLYTNPSNITKQYFQNNPQKARSIELNQIANVNKDNDTFTINAENNKAYEVTHFDLEGNLIKGKVHFLSIYDATLADKYALYEYSTAERKYKRISIARKKHGFNQYNAKGVVIPVGVKRSKNTKAISNKAVAQEHPSFTHEPSPVEPSEKFDPRVVNNTGPVNTFRNLPIDRNLSETDAALDDLFNNIEDAEGVSLYNKQILKALRDANIAQDLTIKYIDDSEKGIGSYNRDTHTVTFNYALMKDFTTSELANTFIHELVHAGTSRTLSLSKNKMSPATLKAVEKLEDLRTQIENHLKKTDGEGYENWKNYYWTWKYDQVTPESKQTSEGLAAYLELNNVTNDSIPSEDREGASKYYGAIKVEEFIAMALTDPGFQQQLNELTDENGTPWFTSLIELINNLLNTLGFDIKRDSLLASAIDNSMELIRQNDPNLSTVIKPTIEVIKKPKYELFPEVYANQGQREAIDALTEFLNSDKKAFLLQGKGGTGKTTIIKKIIQQAKTDKILAIGPTHKAKKVLNKSLKEVNERIPAVTLASALAIKLDEATGKFTPDQWIRDQNRVPITKADLVIIDEASMVSDKLLAEIKKWKKKGAKIIFMGDRAQLPPVGQTTDSEVFNINNGYELTEKMRQVKGSPIIKLGTKVSTNAESSNRVLNPIKSTDRVNTIDTTSGSSLLWEFSIEQALDSFVEDVSNANGNTEHVKIITFNNQNHNNPQSVKNLNAKVRTKLFGERANQEMFIPGEIITSYAAFNEDTGREVPETRFENSEDLIIESVDSKKQVPFTISAYSKKAGNRKIDLQMDIELLELVNDQGELLPPVPVISNSSKQAFRDVINTLRNSDKQLMYKVIKTFANVEHGYAITSHKAQGSTYENVYVMEDNIMGPSNGGTVKAKNQSLYVAVSRPRTKLVMVSSKNSTKSVDLEALKQDLSNESSFNEANLEQSENSPSQEDLDAYNRSRNQEDLPFINAVEEYMKICK
tara:strand:+ start:25 stop:7677 length:7653 start_codon:yes stop_codon:yes gene_type:complete